MLGAHSMAPAGQALDLITIMAYCIDKEAAVVCVHTLCSCVMQLLRSLCRLYAAGQALNSVNVMA